MLLALILVCGAAAAALTYGRLEGLGRRAWPAVLCRAIAWSVLGVLLLDLSCSVPRPGSARPLVLLDGSLSLAAAGGRWREALDSARAWGDVHLFGDAVADADTVPRAGRSVLSPALAAARASGREVVVVTDGEIEDAGDLSPESLRRVAIRLFPRRALEDLSLAEVRGPVEVTQGDTAVFGLEIRSAAARRDSLRVEARLDQQVLARRVVRVAPELGASVTLAVPTARLPAGSHLLEFALAGARDSEPRDDARLWVLAVSRSPAIVFAARPADWDARFLFRAIRDVAKVPLRGYLSFAAGQWRAMETLAPVRADEVSEAAHRAALLILKGSAPELLRARPARGRSLWLWPSGEGGESLLPGEWYAANAGISPLANAFAGLPVDSFPPLTQISPIEPSREDWVGLSVQQGRRGAERPAVLGRVIPGGRQLVTAADGFWRWAFHGGSSEEAYRGMVGSAISWLLAAPDSNAGRAHPIRQVAEQGRPLVFQWTAAGPPVPVPLTLAPVAGETVRPDTLRFDGAGRAELRLPLGRYHYTLEGGGEGVVAVEEYSSEFAPHPVMLAERPLASVRAAGVTSTRQWIWLFALGVAALAGEWVVRKRLGLR
jgi:hypothetical protein